LVARIAIAAKSEPEVFSVSAVQAVWQPSRKAGRYFALTSDAAHCDSLCVLTSDIAKPKSAAANT